MNKSILQKLLLLILLLFLLIILPFKVLEENSSWEKRLYAPTQLQYLDGIYFIVDCWHNRILYNTSLDEQIENWSVLTDDIAGPHSIATDGKHYITEDTGRHRLYVYEKRGSEFVKTQILNDIGKRPHRTVFSAVNGKFYVLSSKSQELFTIVISPQGEAKIESRKKLDFLEGAYTRSFSIIGNRMYFVSGPKKIIVTEFIDNIFEVLEEYIVSEHLQSMNYIVKIGNYYYMTAFDSEMIIRTRNLASLEEGLFEDLHDLLGFKGIPYYISIIGDRIYIPEINKYNSIISFELTGDQITGIQKTFDFGPPIEESILRKNEFTM